MAAVSSSVSDNQGEGQQGEQLATPNADSWKPKAPTGPKNDWVVFVNGKNSCKTQNEHHRQAVVGTGKYPVGQAEPAGTGAERRNLAGSELQGQVLQGEVGSVGSIGIV